MLRNATVRCGSHTALETAKDILSFLPLSLHVDESCKVLVYRMLQPFRADLNKRVSKVLCE